MEEIWKDIPGYEGIYQVSNVGRVRSLRRTITGGKYRINQGIILKEHSDNRGYLQIYLTTQYYKIHRLVAETFIPDKFNFKSMPDEDRSLIDLNSLEVNHKDENKLNNNVNNLEWCTHKYNSNYGTRNLRISKSQMKKILQFDLTGNFIREYDSIKEAKNLNNFSTHIGCCCKGIRKTANGFIWKYKESENNNDK